MSNKWKYAYPLMLWSLCNTLLHLIIAVVFYRARSFEWREGILTAVAGTKNGRTRIWGRPSGQCFGGMFAVYSSEAMRNRADLRVHENCHAVQGLINGPLFLPLYGLAYLVTLCIVRNAKLAIKLNPFEDFAYFQQLAYKTLAGRNHIWALSRWGHGA